MIRIALAIALAAALLACGSGSTETPTPTTPPPTAEPTASYDDPIALLAADTVVIVRSDAKRLVRSPHFERLRAMMMLTPTMRSVDGAADDVMREAWRRTDSWVVGVAASEGGHSLTPPVMITSGDLDSDLLQRWYASVGLTGLQRTTQRGHSVWSAQGESTIDAGRVWVAGPEATVEGSLARAFRERPGARAATRLLDIGRRVGLETSTLAVAVEAIPIINEQLAAMVTPSARSIARIGGRLDLDDGGELHLILETSTSGEAQQLATELRATLEATAAAPTLAATPIPGILRAGVWTVEGPHASVTLTASRQEVETLLAFAYNFLQTVM